MRAVHVMVMAMAMAMAVGAAGGADSAGLPMGSYGGTAHWRGPGGSSGTYEVEKTFAGESLSARYTWNDTQARVEQHRVKFVPRADAPSFDVLDEEGNVIGSGHCYDDACAYRASFGPVQVEESFNWSKGQMTVLGAKSGPGFSVVWRETLQER